MRSARKQPALYRSPAYPGPAPLPSPMLRARAPVDPDMPAGAARWIGVAGIGEDAGATTLVALLSAVYASHRRYRIVAVDVGLTGELGTRLGAPGTATVADIAAAAPDLTSFKRVTPYVDQTTEVSWAVVGRAATVPEMAQCTAAIAALSGFFAVGVLDCGPIGQSLPEGLLNTVHARLLVAPVTVEGVLGAAAALDWVGSRVPTAAWHCAVALVSTQQRPGTDVGWAARLLAGRGGRVIPLPYDPGLAAGGRITPAAVSDGAMGAVRRLATELLSSSARSGE